jgi:ADP-ribose pyrophosphatase YjhB (NUDIX family)
MKKCDHKSVGILVWKDKSLLLIERKKIPWGFAPPAGHVDGDSSFEEAAKRELYEEVGLKALKLKQIAEGRKENKCRRIDGDWHYWKIYEANVANNHLSGNQDETKQVGWYNHEKLIDLAKKTEKYLKGEIKEGEWQKSPGIEPVWLEWFKELKIIEYNQL